MGHVLIADDDRSNCLLLKSMVRSCGLSCDVVHTGRDAIDAVTNRDYGIVFMDLFMPGQNGDEAALRIRSIKTNADCPNFIGIISYDDDDLRKKCVAAGMVDVISKPLYRDAVRKIIHRFQDSIQERPCKPVPCLVDAFQSISCDRDTASQCIQEGSMMLDSSSHKLMDLSWTLEVARCCVFLSEKRKSSKTATSCPANQTAEAGSPGERVADHKSSATSSSTQDANICFATTIAPPSPDRLLLGELMSK
jgi:CheY-like chemotaxis protein